MENKTTKYFKYAIGEIVLVVVGILIALSINNWNENRKQNEIEFQILMQLQKDLKSNLSDLKLNLRLQRNSYNSGKIILKQLKSDNSYNDSLGVHLSNVFLWTKFGLNSGAYENLKSRGLEIITNNNLRSKVIDIYEKHYKNNEVDETPIINHIENFRKNYAYKYFKSLEIGEFKNDKLISGNAEIKDYALLKSDERFNFFIEQVVGDFQYQINALTIKYIESHNEVLVTLEDELNTLKDSK